MGESLINLSPIVLLTMCALAPLAYALRELTTARRRLEREGLRARAERARWQRLLATAAAANESMVSELARQRDQIASLEMRIGAVAAGPSRRPFGG